MYQHAKDLGISTPLFSSLFASALNLLLLPALITISHRPSLFKYHHHLLRLTGHDGVWETTQIGTADEYVSFLALPFPRGVVVLTFALNRNLSFQKEIDTLEERLRDVDKWKARLTEINDELIFKQAS